MASEPKSFLSRAWSGASMQQGAASMLTSMVKREMPDDESGLVSLIQDGSLAKSSA